MIEAIGALLPPIGVGLIFWFVIRSIMRADRAERASLAAAEREAREAATQSGHYGPGSTVHRAPDQREN